MNIGLVADCYRPTVSGVVTSLLQLKEGLETRGHRVLVLTVATPGDGRAEPNVYRFPSISFNAAAGFRLGVVHPGKLERIVREQQLDLIHTHTEYSLGWAGKRAARRAGLPLVHTAHTLHEAYRHYLWGGRLLSPGLVRGFVARFLAGYDAAVCPSHKMAAYVRSFAPGVPAVVVANGIDRSHFQPEPLTPEERCQVRQALGLGPADRVLLYAGRIGREKRVLELLAALAPLLRARPQAMVMFVGGGPGYEALATAAHRSGLRGQVILPGGVDWGQIHRLYAVADLFVTASLSEVQPMTLIEASLCGLPIVARRDTSFVDLVVPGYNGYLADSDQEIAARAAEILDDRATQIRFAANALVLAERFSAQAHAAQLEALYRRVIEHRAITKG